MTFELWAVVTATEQLAPLVAAGLSGGAAVSAVAVGPLELAQTASGMGVAKVYWIETSPGLAAEAYTGAVGELARRSAARAWLASAAPGPRALLGAAAAATGAGLTTGGVALRLDGEQVVVEREALDGAVIETVAANGPIAVVWGLGEGEPAVGAPPAEIEPVPAASPWAVESLSIEAAGGGLSQASRVVGVGRGVRARADLALVEELAEAFGAEVGCSMPLADDLHWYAEERYIGRSGLRIAPAVYLALGISGQPQHVEGVRGARVIAAVNSDPEAPIFKTATYGIAQDLYEVAPALVRALRDN
ncbi:MAG: FAD-binding protein [Bifidobacteriaceae bacterium]|jgi:electron transfer flavoprotein alpha subunit|nr:FAD-binding protein [Bifidobacteriaceae bacterium]